MTIHRRVFKLNEKSVIKKVEELNKEKTIKSLKETIRLEIDELRRLNKQLDTSTIEKSIERLQMTANRINFSISCLYDGIY